MVKANLLTESAETGTVFQYKTPADGEDRRYCKCGCNQQVVGKKLYRPGHDARHVAALVTGVVALGSSGPKVNKAIAAAFNILSGSPRLQAKFISRLITLGVDYQFETLLVEQDDDESDE